MFDTYSNYSRANRPRNRTRNRSGYRRMWPGKEGPPRGYIPSAPNIRNGRYPNMADETNKRDFFISLLPPNVTEDDIKRQFARSSIHDLRVSIRERVHDHTRFAFVGVRTMGDFHRVKEMGDLILNGQPVRLSISRENTKENEEMSYKARLNMVLIEADDLGIDLQKVLSTPIAPAVPDTNVTGCTTYHTLNHVQEQVIIAKSLEIDPRTNQPKDVYKIETDPISKFDDVKQDDLEWEEICNYYEQPGISVFDNFHQSFDIARKLDKLIGRNTAAEMSQMTSNPTSSNSLLRSLHFEKKARTVGERTSSGEQRTNSTVSLSSMSTDAGYTTKSTTSLDSSQPRSHQPSEEYVTRGDPGGISRGGEGSKGKSRNSRERLNNVSNELWTQYNTFHRSSYNQIVDRHPPDSDQEPPTPLPRLTLRQKQAEHKFDCPYYFKYFDDGNNPVQNIPVVHQETSQSSLLDGVNQLSLNEESGPNIYQGNLIDFPSSDEEMDVSEEHNFQHPRVGQKRSAESIQLPSYYDSNEPDTTENLNILIVFRSDIIAMELDNDFSNLDGTSFQISQVLQNLVDQAIVTETEIERDTNGIEKNISNSKREICEIEDLIGGLGEDDQELIEDIKETSLADWQKTYNEQKAELLLKKISNVIMFQSHMQKLSV